jgi:triose/dihydroxyacetone kinase / FAD-AMP lyase (cyclizing)
VTELLQHADRLGANDALTGDGDFGTTLRSGCEALQAMILADDFTRLDDASTCLRISESTGASMGGTSGSLTSTFFEACSAEYATSGDWRRAFVVGTDAISTAGGANVGDRTMIDALRPAADILGSGGDVLAAAESAKRGAASTANMTTTKFGRSSHVSSAHLEGVIDPGAEAVAIALDAFAKARGDQ